MEEQHIGHTNYLLAQKLGFVIIKKSMYEQVRRYYVDSGGNETSDSFFELQLVTKEIIPTQSLVQKWLRDEHKIYVEVEHFDIDDDGSPCDYFTYNLYSNLVDEEGDDDSTFTTYERALEVGINEGLKLLNND